jgi:hypothetical protein
MDRVTGALARFEDTTRWVAGLDHVGDADCVDSRIPSGAARR